MQVDLEAQIPILLVPVSDILQHSSATVALSLPVALYGSSLLASQGNTLT